MIRRPFASTSRNVEISLHSEILSYNHHVLVAKYPSPQQARDLAYAVEQGLSVSAFRQWLKRDKPRLLSGRWAETPKLAISKLDKLTQRHPSTYTLEDSEALLEYAAEVQTWLDLVISRGRYGIEKKSK